ncbi:hypothetical protein [Solicola gregarius]|uniref:Uncharacterized protein n=1 Tax=Solicola gregarius TaxID=2908642 RepID=A0AA46YKM9_9ACTN|nr:hypothetical protein [Solicola gregarius]UYM04754.1 hypothetical protein L0C25_19790 [Solicola gregarius]
MPTRPDAVRVRPARRTRLPSSLVSILAVTAFVAASIAGVFGGTHAASAAPAETHSVGSDKIVGHQPTKTRVSVGGDRSDHPQHRATPWIPLAVTPDESEMAAPSESAPTVVVSAVPWHSYDVTTPQGRAPPR